MRGTKLATILYLTCILVVCAIFAYAAEVAINDQTATTDVASGDKFPMYDASNTAGRAITASNLAAGLAALFGEGDIAEGTILGEDIADDAIDSEHYSDDSIDDTHINWGTGTGQVSTDDVTEGSTNKFEGTTAGDFLTLTGEDIDLDAEVYTDTKCIYIEDPADTDDLQSIWTANGFAATITKIWCEADAADGVQLDLQVDDGTPADVNGTDLDCDSTPAEDESMGGDATMADGDRLDLVITSVDGTVNWVVICWTYVKVD